MSADAAVPHEPSGPSERGEAPATPALEELLDSLRCLATPCEPPIGIGAFDVLYANAREVVVWYSPARPEHLPGEVAIATGWLAAAWEALVAGEALDEPSLVDLCERRAGSGRWVLALLAQAPGVAIREETPEEPFALVWSAATWQTWQLKRIAGRQSNEEPAEEPAPIRTRRSRSRRTSAE